MAKRSTLTFQCSKMTKINCPKLQKMTSNFLDFRGFRKRERDRELVPYKEVCLFLIFHIPTIAS